MSPKNVVFSVAVTSLLIIQIIDAININHQDSIHLNKFSYKLENLRRLTRQTNQCLIPNNPVHTTYKVISETETEYGPGDYVRNYNIIQITCDREYKINPISQNYSICINGRWTPPLTNCLRACPSLTSITSTQVSCKWNDLDGNEIPLKNCIHPVEGTTVYLSCNSFFEEASITKNPIRLCREGRWDPSIPQCYPICGLKRPKASSNIINGTNTEPGDYPWQVGIYNSHKSLICGGSILDYRVILSAAHCFTDHDGNIKPPENYFLAAGKYYRQYDDYRDKFAQYSKILKIHIPHRYKGRTNLQGFDIAIIILADAFEISLHVQPVCIELTEESQDLNLSLNKNGIAVGWGYTQNGRELSDELKEVVIPYIPFDECFNLVPNNFKRYITHDKICGGYINNGTSVCGGDSGGGLIFEKLNSDRHYIKGIVSVSPATEEGVCDSNQISVFTSVVHHTNFVRKLLAYNQIRQNIECPQDDCLIELENRSLDQCSNSNSASCRNTKKSCTLPNFPLNGKYVLNQNDTYEPGGYVPSNSLLSLTCDTGFGLTPLGATKFYCSDEGEWTPPLKPCKHKVKTCITPNNETGICIKLNECKVIKRALSSRTIEARSFAQKSQCGKSDESLVCCGSSGFPTVVFQHPLLPGPDECGIQAVDDLDTEGLSQAKEFPWMALLVHTEENTMLEYFGRTSLISKRYVLTTAYLIRPRPGLTLSSVRLGVYQASSNCEGLMRNQGCNPFAINLGIESVVVHPDYSWKLRIHDIALLRLDRNVHFNEYVRPICLPTPTSTLPNNSDLWLSGWGDIETNKTKLKHKGKVSLLSEIVCDFRTSINITASQFCAVAYDSVTRKSICLGDLAGPTVRKISQGSRNQWIQEGITSFSYIVCHSSSGYTGVYTRVSKYVNWIVDSMIT